MAIVGPQGALARHRPALDDLCRALGTFAGLDRESLAALAALAPDVVLFLPTTAVPTERWAALARSCRAMIVIAAGTEHLVAAFDAGAVDYLIHPFDGGALFRALRRAARRARLPPAPAPPALPPLERFAVRRGGRLRLLAADEVLWIRSDGNYVELATGGGRYRLRARLGELAARLDPRRFLRVHRCHLVKIDAVVELAHVGRGEYELTLSDGATLKLSRSYRASLEALRAPTRPRRAADT